MTHYPNSIISYGTKGARKIVNEFKWKKQTDYQKEDVIRILRKIKRILGYEWTDSTHMVIGPAAEVLRGVLGECQSVQLYLMPDEVSRKHDNFSQWDKRIKHSCLEIDIKMRDIPKTVQLHDLQDGDHCLVYCELIPLVTIDKYVFNDIGIRIPTTSTNLAFWNQLNLGRVNEKEVLETVVTAHLAGELEEEDYQLFGEIYRWRVNGGLINDAYENIISKINKQKDSKKWLDAMDA